MNILYEDNHLLFAVKPPNIPVQADASGDRDMTQIVKQYIKEAYHKPGEVYLGLVHRLDRPVGGLMCFCKTSKAAARVSAAWQSREVTKLYLCVAEGVMPPEGELVDYITRDVAGNTARLCDKNAPGAKEARLTYKTIAVRNGLSLVQVALGTGRRHQIRLQMAGCGHPLWGDNRYGYGKPGQQIALWSSYIALTHPTTKQPVAVCCPPPAQQMPFSQFAHEIAKPLPY